jgi:CRP/FNR family transcriptional regulator, cyclic AMP receptor protein
MGLSQENVLRSVPLFSGLSRSQLESILAVSQTREFPKDTLLFREGDRGDSLYLVISGRVKAVLLAEDGRELILAFLGPGELFGEMALFDPEERRTATVISAEQSSLLILSGKQFMGLLMENPAIALSLLHTLTRRLKDTGIRIANLIFLDTYSRVGGYLLKMAEQQGRRLADGSLVLTRPPQQEIAHFIGSSRETVSRALRELEHQGLIRMIGKKIILNRLKP